jgi:hypothetical protein
MIGIIAKCILIGAVIGAVSYAIYLIKFALENWTDD